MIAAPAVDAAPFEGVETISKTPDDTMAMASRDRRRAIASLLKESRSAMGRRIRVTHTKALPIAIESLRGATSPGAPAFSSAHICDRSPSCDGSSRQTYVDFPDPD